MMSSSLWTKSLYLLFLTCPLLLARPNGHTRTNQNLPTDPKDDHTIPKRSTTGLTVGHDFDSPAHPCTTALDCYPTNYRNDTIPTNFVNCTDGRTCACSECFYRLNDTCALLECHHFENDSGKCVDDRKSQTNIFILSFFLSSVGYANFAIGQNVLGELVYST